MTKMSPHAARTAGPGGDRPAWATWIAAGFGSGFAPVAPGTFGSLVGVALGLPLLWPGLPLPAGLGPAPLLIAAAGVAAGVGWLAIRRASDGGDHGWIVIDEIAGQLLALAALPRLAWPPTVWTVGGPCLAFLLFRAFDIAKPGPIGWADRRHGAAGIVGDDLIAGAFAGLTILAGRLLATQWR